MTIGCRYLVSFLASPHNQSVDRICDLCICFAYAIEVFLLLVGVFVWCGFVRGCDKCIRHGFHKAGRDLPVVEFLFLATLSLFRTEDPEPRV